MERQIEEFLCNSKSICLQYTQGNIDGDTLVNSLRTTVGRLHFKQETIARISSLEEEIKELEAKL